MTKNRNKPKPLRQRAQGDPRKNYERYLALARAAALSGDGIAEENCYQHAEHFLRVLRGE